MRHWWQRQRKLRSLKARSNTMSILWTTRTTSNLRSRQSRHRSRSRSHIVARQDHRALRHRVQALGRGARPGARRVPVVPAHDRRLEEAWRADASPLRLRRLPRAGVPRARRARRAARVHERAVGHRHHRQGEGRRERADGARVGSDRDRRVRLHRQADSRSVVVLLPPLLRNTRERLDGGGAGGLRGIVPRDA